MTTILLTIAAWVSLGLSVGLVALFAREMRRRGWVEDDEGRPMSPGQTVIFLFVLVCVLATSVQGVLL